MSNTFDVEREIAALAQIGQTTVEQIHAAFRPRVAAMTARQQRKVAGAAINVSKSAIERRQWQRACVGIVAALSIDEHSLYRVESEGLLFDATLGKNPRTVLLEALRTKCSSGDSCLRVLRDRLATYDLLEEMATVCEPLFHSYRFALRNRRPGLIRAAMAAAEFAFLLPRRPALIEKLAPVVPLPKTLPANHEGLVEAVSRLIAEAHEERAIEESEECEVPIFDLMKSEELSGLLTLAVLRQTISDFAREVRIFGYSITREIGGGRPVYVLRPHDDAFESSIRVGHIGEDALQYYDALARPGTEAVAAPDAADTMTRLAERSTLRMVELADEPHKRAVIFLPTAGDDAWENLVNMKYAEDHYDQQRISRLLVDDRELRQTQLVDGLPFERFRVLHRRLRLALLLYSEFVQSAAAHDPERFVNSMVMAWPRRTFEDLLGASAADKRDIRKTLEVLSWPRGTERKHLDLQYTPLVVGPLKAMVGPSVFAYSNASRNVLSSASKRVANAGLAFETRVGKLLNTRFAHVALRKQVGTIGEVDVATIVDKTLYILECKHSLPPATIVEHRDLRQDVHRAVEQLRDISQALTGEGLGSGRLRDWFPQFDGDFASLSVRPCVLLSAGPLSGFVLEGTPVRDFFSLEKFLNHGRVNVVHVKGNTRRVYVFRLWKSAEFSSIDLADYFKADGRYARWKMMNVTKVTRVDLSTKIFRLAHESFIKRFPADEKEFVADLEGCGLIFEGVKEEALPVALREGAEFAIDS